jgi:cation diffusion facilitator CzcD-associated flavoprotein CzcO
MVAEKVCIIGAGSSGIVACKVLKEHGIPFDCFEAGSAIGGNWRYNNDNGMSSAYRSLHINTSRRMMEYADFPMPAHYPHFPHHSQIIEYFDNYVEHFGLRSLITFNTKVIEVSKAENGTYKVSTDQGQSEIYRAVIVANGHHWNPRYPEPMFPGTFTGETIHSHYYKTPDMLENKNVCVVGIGNSAVDIACEAARLHSGNVFLSTRSGAYIMPNYLLGKPIDELSKDVPHWLPLWMKRKILAFSLWLAYGNQESYGFPKPKRPLLTEHPTNSQDILNLVGRGKVKIKPNIKELAGDSVIFEDGTKEKIDVIVWCTGYKITFPFFKKDFFDAEAVEETNQIHLYKKVIHPEYPNLFFLGLVQPLGAIMPLAETQSIWIAKLMTGEVALPSKELMQKDINKDLADMRKRYKESKRHTIQVDYMPYKVSLEKEIKRMKTGKKPTPAEVLTKA